MDYRWEAHVPFRRLAIHIPIFRAATHHHACSSPTCHLLNTETAKCLHLLKNQSFYLILGMVALLCFRLRPQPWLSFCPSWRRVWVLESDPASGESLRPRSLDHATPFPLNDVVLERGTPSQSLWPAWEFGMWWSIWRFPIRATCYVYHPARSDTTTHLLTNCLLISPTPPLSSPSTNHSPLELLCSGYRFGLFDSVPSLWSGRISTPDPNYQA